MGKAWAGGPVYGGGNAWVLGAAKFQRRRARTCKRRADDDPGRRRAQQGLNARPIVRKRRDCPSRPRCCDHKRARSGFNTKLLAERHPFLPTNSAQPFSRRRQLAEIV